MKVIFTGRYLANTVNYRGENFTKGQPTDVSDEWYEFNKGGDIQPFKAKRKAKSKSAD